MQWSCSRSLFVGIWVECLTRALLAPRGNLGYVYERIPSLVLATFFVVTLVTSIEWILRTKAVEWDVSPNEQKV